MHGISNRRRLKLSYTYISYILKIDLLVPLIIPDVTPHTYIPCNNSKFPISVFIFRLCHIVLPIGFQQSSDP